MRILTFHPYPNLKRVFALRDVGQIGKQLAELCSASSYVWCLRQKQEVDFVDSGQHWVGHGGLLGMLLKLYQHAEFFDVLHLFHISWRSVLACLIYKVHSNGYIILKTDLTYDAKKSPILLNSIKFKVLSWLVDDFGLDDQRLLKIARVQSPKLSGKFSLLTGGVDQNSPFSTDPKQQEIALCGRFGEARKNYELFLELIESDKLPALKDWGFNLIGLCSPEFERRLENLFIKLPELRDKFLLTGEISDRQQINQLLSRSKIFVHTALAEADPNVQYEAMWCGCILVSSSVGNIEQNYPAAYSFFYKPNTVDQLATALHSAIELCSKAQPKDFDLIHQYALRNFSWRAILTPIANKIRTVHDK